MKIKNPSWLIVSFLASYFLGVSAGAEWQWYFQTVFWAFYMVSLYLSNK